MGKQKQYGEQIARDDLGIYSQKGKKLTAEEVRVIPYGDGNLLTHIVSHAVVGYLDRIGVENQGGCSAVLEHCPVIVKWLKDSSNETREEHAREHYSALVKLAESESVSPNPIREVLGYLEIRFPKEIKSLKRGMVA